MAIWHDRLKEELDAQGKSWGALSRACGVTTAAAAGWSTGKTQSMQYTHMIDAAKFLKVSPEWLAGHTNIKHDITNMNLVKDAPDEDDVQIPQFDAYAAAGAGYQNYVAEERPKDYVTFKRNWLRKKSLQTESLCVIYARGDSMALQINSNDIVLIRTDRRVVIDDGVFAILYGDEARLKRISIRASGSIGLVSDNDPDGLKYEEIAPDTLDQLTIIGQAVWRGGDII